MFIGNTLITFTLGKEVNLLFQLGFHNTEET